MMEERYGNIALLHKLICSAMADMSDGSKRSERAAMAAGVRMAARVLTGETPESVLARVELAEDMRESIAALR